MDNSNSNSINNNSNIVNQGSNKSLITIETFDGIRKSNSRKIFGILLIIIIIDFGIDLVM